MTILRRNVLTAQRRSNNLKEHLEGFLSVNGVGPEELPDPKTQMSGHIAELLERQRIPFKAITQTAFKIRRIEGLKDMFTHVQVLTIIAKAMGYTSSTGMSHAAIGENRIVVNKNHGIGLARSLDAAEVDNSKQTLAFWEIVSEVFIYVKANDFTVDHLETEGRADGYSEWMDRFVHPIADASGIKVTIPEAPELNWTPIIFSMALASKYQPWLTRKAWKLAYKRIHGLTTLGESRNLSMDFMRRSLEYLQNFGK